MDREKTVLDKKKEKRYYKPHFGPEETDSTIMKEIQKSSMQRTLINDFLNYQIESKQAEKQSLIESEKKKDL